MSRNLRFKINWASFIVGSKFTVFALFYFVFEGNFPSTSPQRAYIWRGDLTKGFLRYWFGGVIKYLEGLIHGGAYFWNFTVPGVDYVGKNWALAIMLKALPLVQFWNVLLLKEQDLVMTSVRKTLKTLVWSTQN